MSNGSGRDQGIRKWQQVFSLGVFGGIGFRQAVLSEPGPITTGRCRKQILQWPTVLFPTSWPGGILYHEGQVPFDREVIQIRIWLEQVTRIGLVKNHEV